MSSLNDFFVTLQDQNIKSADEYKSMFEIPKVQENGEDQTKYNKCVWDTQGKVLCTGWGVNEKGGFLVSSEKK
jgi:hypothetical protein